VGVIFSNAPAEYQRPVELFGERIGVAFQLIDDVIDLAGELDETGKEPGTDLRAGVATLPLLYLRRLAQTDSDADELLRRIERDVTSAFYGDADDADLTAAIAELRAHPVTAQTLDEAHRWSRDAVDALAPLPQGPVKKALTRFAESIVERSN
jgi:heptaprenyl diphosphate synthase